MTERSAEPRPRPRDPIWIVHREPAARAALARLAVRAGAEAVRAGPPEPRAFALARGRDGRGEEAADTPRAVLLGLAGNLEAELAFAEACAARFPAAGLVLVHTPARAEEVAARATGLRATLLPDPPDVMALRGALGRAAAPGRDVSLAARRRRAFLEERFERWFADLPLPSPGAAAWRRRRALVRGEPGSGRMLLARALHERGGRPRGAFVHLPCEAGTGLPELARALEAAAGDVLPGAPTFCLEGVEALAPPVQRALRSWIELGPPETALPLSRVRWIAVADARGPELDAGLVDVLADLAFRIPPLRERRAAVPAFVRTTAARWAAASGVAARPFATEALARLREDPWPGNLRELEAVVARLLAAGGEAPVQREEVEALLAGEAGGAEARSEEALDADALPPAPEADVADAPAPAGSATRSEADAAPPGAAPPRSAPAAPARRPHRASGVAPPEAPALPRLARSLDHELRNPLTGIRTWAALLTERFDDAEFREGFRSRVEQDVGRMVDTLDRLQAFAGLDAQAPEAVDVAALLEELLEARRPEIQRRRILVLQELDRAEPCAFGDPGRLRFAFEALLDRTLAWVPDRADVYVASRHHPGGTGGTPPDRPTLRVLLRFHHPGAAPPAGRSGEAASGEATAEATPRENAVELALAEAALRAEGGSLTVDADGDETVLLLDLPAPPAGSANRPA